jgi:hypothetical protein
LLEYVPFVIATTPRFSRQWVQGSVLAGTNTRIISSGVDEEKIYRTKSVKFGNGDGGGGKRTAV